MEKSMKEIGKMMKKMEQVYKLGQMERSMLEIGGMISVKVKEL